MQFKRIICQVSVTLIFVTGSSYSQDFLSLEETLAKGPKQKIQGTEPSVTPELKKRAVREFPTNAPIPSVAQSEDPVDEFETSKEYCLPGSANSSPLGSGGSSMSVDANGNPVYRGHAGKKHRKRGWRNLFTPKNLRIVRYIKEPKEVLPPVGASVNAFWNIQVINGQESQMVLYRFDFVAARPELTPRGLKQLDKFVVLLNTSPLPLTIQPSMQGPLLDQQRYHQVMQALSARGVNVTPDRVLLRTPPTRGLDGVDAQSIQPQLQGSSSAATATPPSIQGN